MSLVLLPCILSQVAKGHNRPLNSPSHVYRHAPTVTPLYLTLDIRNNTLRLYDLPPRSSPSVRSDLHLQLHSLHHTHPARRLVINIASLIPLSVSQLASFISIHLAVSEHFWQLDLLIRPLINPLNTFCLFCGSCSAIFRCITELWNVLNSVNSWFMPAQTLRTLGQQNATKIHNMIVEASVDYIEVLKKKLGVCFSFLKATHYLHRHLFSLPWEKSVIQRICGQKRIASLSTQLQLTGYIKHNLEI